MKKEGYQQGLLVLRDGFHDYVNAVGRRHGLSHAELMILFLLNDYSECDTAGHIAELCCLSKSRVSGAVHKLIERGLLCSKADAHDRRTVHLALQPDAMSIIADVMRAQKQFFRQMLRGFTEQEKRVLRDYFTRMVRNLKGTDGKEETR